MRVLHLVLVLGMFSQSARADIRGNGGDVVVCKDEAGDVSRIELLDFYEGLHRYRLPPGMVQGQTYQEKLHNMLDQLERIDHEFVAGLRTDVDEFEENAHFWPGIQLVDIPDSGHIAIPHGCEIVQIAVQKEPEFPGEKVFTISKDLWDHPALSERDRAGLVFHEVLYRRALKQGHTDSVKTRYLNAFLTSTLFDVNNVMVYFDVLSRTKFYLPRTFGYQGLKMKNDQALFHDNGFLKRGRLIENGEWTLTNGDHFYFNTEGVHWIYFHENRVLKSASVSVPTEVSLQNGSIRAKGGIVFDDQERLILVRVGVDPEDGIVLPTVPSVKVHGDVAIFEGQHPVGGWSAEDQNTTVCGENIRFRKSTFIKYDPALSFVSYLGSMDHATQENRQCYLNPDTGIIEKRVWEGGSYYFFPDGRVLSFSIIAAKEFNIQSVAVKLNGNIVFHENGQVASGELAVPVRLKDVNGIVRDYGAGKTMLFDAQGLVL